LCIITNNNQKTFTIIIKDNDGLSSFTCDGKEVMVEPNDVTRDFMFERQ
jgi:hypothetical protein